MRGHRVTILIAAVAAGILVACAPDPVDWDDPAPLPPRLTAAAEIGLDPSGQLVPRTQPPVALPVFTRQCTATVRVSGDSVSGWFGLWWGVRDDSTAELVMSHSADGYTWGPGIAVDSVDVARTGCERVPPSIFVDGPNVYAAYAMTAREGAGVFSTHSMDGGITFHAPVTVAYGDHPGRTAIAARNELVVVAYEDPNADPPRVTIAISRSGGHLFETGVVASPPTGAARAPGVALGDGRIAVTWTTGGATGADASAPRIVRTGDLR